MKSLAPALFAAFAASGTAGQESPPAARAGTPAPCPDGVISYVFIDNHSIFDTSDPELDRRFAWAYGIANALHARTRAYVIRRELLFDAGDCYDPLLLRESERLLRAYDFLSHVDIFGLRQPDSTWHVIVDTRDEWSTQLDLRVRFDGGVRFDGVRLRENNLLGTGQAVAFHYIERDVTRDVIVSYATPQLARTRWDLRVAAGRTRAGTLVDQVIAYPFVGEIGKWAFRQSFRREDRFFDYIAGDAVENETRVLFPVRDKAVDLAAIARVGHPGALTLFGVAIGFRELSFPGADSAEIVRGKDFNATSGADSALLAEIQRQAEPAENVRLMLLLGKRNVRWVQRRGFDSMRGVQDIRLGAEAELAIGRSLGLGRTDRDLITSLGLYGAREDAGILLAGHLRLDARKDYDDGGRWKDLFVEGEGFAYWKPGGDSRHTLVLRAAGAGGWQTRTPFQLTLGGDRALRGYARERFPGGRRVIFSVEDRIYIGWPLPDVLDLGATIFADVGRVWPGDVPFGTDSGWRTTAGFGLRGSFPAGGRTTYRLDLAFPVGHHAKPRDVRLILSIGELLGLVTRPDDTQMPRARTNGFNGELFHFPN
ncbi:MAG TPA: BamA/TamA family outer membrane protein [Longimicrobiales bacterium]